MRFSLRPEPDYTGDYVGEFRIEVVEVTPDGVRLRMLAEDGDGPQGVWEQVIKPGREWSFTWRLTKE